jgi:broad specificity phosphatase PhoE
MQSKIPTSMVKLVFIRHSKSCANLVRHIAGTEELTHPLVIASQLIRDPPLSSVGERMAEAYGPTLRRYLAAQGVDIDDARTVVGSSALLRARQTVRLLFPSRARSAVVFPHFTEHGAVPENTPAGARYRRPDWDAFVAYLHREYADAEAVVVVGHGSFLRSAVWAAVTGSRRAEPFANLDAIQVAGTFGADGRFEVSDVRVLPYTGTVNPRTLLDTCPLTPRTKIAATRRMPRHQRGGSVGMPLAYFKDGAQMYGTTSMPTGTGLAATTTAWARTELAQTGGRRTRRCRVQRGGFPASVMGSFATNGARVIPVAAYMGYQMMKGTRKASRRTHSRRGRTGRRGGRR